jgi:predicted phosphodiesterase
LTTRNVTPWTAAEVALLRSYVQQGLGYDQIVKRFAQDGIQRTYKAVQRKAQKERCADPARWHAMVQPATTPRYDRPIEVEGDALVLADIHCPFHDAAFINAAIGLALKRDVRQVVLAGDLADFNAFSTFGRDVGIDADAELDALVELVDTIAASFARVIYIAGNHDIRPLRAVRYAGMTLERLARMFTPRVDDRQFAVSDYQWCKLRSGGVLWHIEHPKNASVIPTHVARKLAAKYECSVATAHGHTWGVSRSDSGRHWAVDTGICADPLRLGYTQLVHNTRPVQMQGAVIVQGGLPLLVSPQTIGMY